MAQDVENTRLTDQSGYTGYANVIAVPDYMNFRRFKVLRVRMLLRQQFKIERMEKQLSELDQVDRENNALWLNSQKMDGNQERERLFEELNTAMASYDDLLKRSHYIVTAPEPSSQRVADLQQAIKSYIVKDERGYLDEDLLNIAGAQDPRLGKLLLVSEYLVYLAAMLWDQTRKVLGLFKATDRFYVTPALFRKVARTISAVLSAVILMLPIIILNVVKTSTLRLVVVFLSAISFISALTILTAAGTMEVFVAGATYSAVLVVFVSQNGMAGSGI
ncbi:uncharacterized protein BKA78DRAFT_350500 [Phyllosticta capitalensis]|uniref:uncharacterized protein n=1 Tax=Phyllosticta capitalensis TaxID=121624 RepID=UPI00312FD92B